MEFNLGQCQGPCGSSSSRNSLLATKSASGQSVLMEPMDLCRLLHHLELHLAATAIVSCPGRERLHSPACSHSSSHSANSYAEMLLRPAMAGFPCLNRTILMLLSPSSCLRSLGTWCSLNVMLPLAVFVTHIRYRAGTQDGKADAHDTAEAAVQRPENRAMAGPHRLNVPNHQPHGCFQTTPGALPGKRRIAQNIPPLSPRAPLENDVSIRLRGSHC